MTAFFAKPKLPARVSLPESPQEAAEGSVSVSCEVAEASAASGTATPTATHYERTFLPFSIPSHTTFAPASHFTWDAEAQTHLQNSFDMNAQSSSTNLSTILNLAPQEVKPRGQRFRRVRDIVLQLSEQPTANCSGSDLQNPRTALNRIPIKYLFYHTDVRPPYIGTNTKLTSRQELAKLGRDPLRKQRPELNYDYDSEAEWEEPEEGEDLHSEGESDTESVDEDEEMDGFLDDEDGTERPRKKRLLDSSLDVICTGLQWQDSSGHLDGTIASSMADYKMRLLSG